MKVFYCTFLRDPSASYKTVCVIEALDIIQARKTFYQDLQRKGWHEGYFSNRYCSVVEMSWSLPWKMEEARVLEYKEVPV